MFGTGGDPFGGQQQEQFGGPLGDIEQQVAGVLNSADQHRIYIPAGLGGIITVPRPQYPAVDRPAAPLYAGQHQVGERLTLGDVGVLILGLTVVAGVVAAVAGVVLLLIK